MALRHCVFSVQQEPISRSSAPSQWGLTTCLWMKSRNGKHSRGGVGGQGSEGRPRVGEKGSLLAHVCLRERAEWMMLKSCTCAQVTETQVTISYG